MKKVRCLWANPNNQLYIDYHDKEWGVPVHDDTKLFEFIVLEGAQAGLSWETILNRREGYRKAFRNFDPRKVAKLTGVDIENLMDDTGIIRNRLKIASTVSNAQFFLATQKEFETFTHYLDSFFVKEKLPIYGSKKMKQERYSALVSIDLKKRGFKFVGQTIMQSFLEATGYYNNHDRNCFCFH